jgi:hypothetical protein
MTEIRSLTDLAEYAQDQIDRITRMQQQLNDYVGEGESPRAWCTPVLARAAACWTCGSARTRCACPPKAPLRRSPRDRRRPTRLREPRRRHHGPRPRVAP